MKRRWVLNLIMLAALLLLMCISIYLYSGVKEGFMNLFISYAVLLPIIMMGWKKDRFLLDLIFSLLGAAILLIWAAAFWSHKDQINIYFSFENPFRWQLMIILSVASTGIGCLIRWLQMRFMKV